MKERRYFERFNVDFPVTFVDLKRNKEGAGKMINISAGGGGMIITSDELEPNTPLEMSLHLPNNRDPIFATGTVAWTSPIEPKGCRVGVQFEKVDFLDIAQALNLNYPNK